MAWLSFEQELDYIKITNNRSNRCCYVDINPKKTYLQVFNEAKYPTRIRFYCYSELVSAIQNHVIGTNEGEKLGGRLVKAPDYVKHEWCAVNLRKYISKAFHGYWKSLLNKANPTLLELDKAIFKVVGPKSLSELDHIYLSEELLSNRYLIQDAINYRAAALALTHINSNYPPTLEQWQWIPEYSSESKPYTSLNKTLYGVQYVIPYHALRGATKPGKLMFPLLTRESIISATLLNDRGANRHGDILLRSDKESWNRVKREYKKLPIGQHIKFHKSSRIYELVSYLHDYPEPYNGDLVGLLRRSEIWHRDNERNRRTKCSSNYSSNTKVIELPTLPESKDIKFLATAGEIIEEGSVMRHCVASYVDYCIKGRSYIFHIEHAGKSATAEIIKSATGSYTLSQIQGPCNQKNEATKWGETYLNKFIKEKLNDGKSVTVSTDNDDL